MSVLWTLSCVLNPEQVELWSEICQRDLRTTEQYKSSLPKLRSCILHEISQYKLSQKETQGSPHDPLLTKQPIACEYKLHKPASAGQSAGHVETHRST